MQIKWPSGKKSEEFVKTVQRYSDAILGGTVLGIDPATHSAGWARYEAGKLAASGTIKTNGRSPVQGRLHQLYDALIPMAGATVVAIEKIQGPTVHYYLKWAVGVCIAALKGYYLIEVPTQFWQKLRDENYKKTDENDAILIGKVVCMVAKEFYDQNNITKND